MKYAARFEFGLFNGPKDPTDALLSLRAVTHLCDALYRCNVDFLLAYGHLVPRLYDSPVYYKSPENACGGDVWQDTRTLFERGFGDCKDLACFRAAELTVKDRIYAKPVVKRKWLDKGFGLYHIVVALPNGTFEDPSLIKGMNPSEAA